MSPLRRLPSAMILLLAAASVAPPAEAELGADGAKAYDMARAADDAAVAAHDEGTAFLKQLRALDAAGREAEPLKALLDEAAGASQALAGYRKLAQASAGEALQLLLDLTRAATPDPIRREVVEQRALLGAHEAALMAARARTEAERLRALLAEARALGAAGAAGAGGAARPAGPPAAAAAPGREIEVPNLVGARLDAAVRDLAALGLRLGPTTGPRDGFVVKQTPTAGARVPRQAAVGVTLSATAAGVTSPPPR